ncbi:hypothetical protein RUM44_001623 [Polyplax serrata]|uniref:MARVEL domain-containing protein n=1 Tax=Polyplax serrata TaxID=468196 RepID=A0ABR1AKL1_POLSC
MAPYKEDNLTIRALCKKPVFAVRLSFIILLTIFSLWNTINMKWPRYCKMQTWAFFNNIGAILALIVIEATTLITWIVFENANWMFFFIVYTATSFLLLLSAVVYFIDEDNSCDLPNTAIDIVNESIMFFFSIFYLGLAITAIVMGRKFCD